MSSVEWEAQRLLGRGQLLAMLLGRAAYSEIMACSGCTLEGEPSLDTPLHLADGKDEKKIISHLGDQPRHSELILNTL